MVPVGVQGVLYGGDQCGCCINGMSVSALVRIIIYNDLCTTSLEMGVI
jgi:hypothetical protein